MDLAWDKQRPTWRSLIFMRVKPPAQFTSVDHHGNAIELMGAGAASHGIEGAFARDREQQVVQQDLCK